MFKVLSISPDVVSVVLDGHIVAEVQISDKQHVTVTGFDTANGTTDVFHSEVNRKLIRFKDENEQSDKTPLTDTARVLELINESEHRIPDQTTEQRRAESARIAREVYGKASRKNIARVAGVRSARTKGLYD